MIVITVFTLLTYNKNILLSYMVIKYYCVKLLLIARTDEDFKWDAYGVCLETYRFKYLKGYNDTKTNFLLLGF